METAAECDCDAAAAEIIVGSVSSDSSRVETTPSPPPPPGKKPTVNPIDVVLLKATDDSKSPTPPLPKKKASSGQWTMAGWDYDSEDEDESDSEEVKQFLREEAEYHTDGVHGMTPREARIYSKMVEESDGFDVEALPGVYALSLIVPFGPINETRMVEFTNYANLALAEYNAEHGTDFECVKIIKANWEAACVVNYYLTFEVKSDGVPNQIFQAMVLHGVTTVTINLCRPKPNP